MAKSISDKTKKRRLRRKKIILTVFKFFKNIYGFILQNTSFKKSVIVVCLSYLFHFVAWTQGHYERLGMPYPTELAIAIVTVLVGELALTALTSIKEKEISDCDTCEHKQNSVYENEIGDEHNYG